MFVLASTAPLIYGLAAGLVLLAIVLSILGVRLMRTTKRDHVALGPLEAMDGRGYRSGDDSGRTAALAAARPVGAKPLPDAPSLEVGTQK